MITTHEISLRTQGNGDIVDITAKVQKYVMDSGIENGVATVFVTHSTVGITTVEFEPGLVADLQKAWERLIPKDIPYDHDSRWGDGNGYAHVRASLLGASLVIPFTDRKLALGTWQQIILIDFDNRARNRTVIIQIMGE
ncbi:MAG: secondary thiamine-phosphate synthase enzyme YjbQ [Dehalococcoidales bacterium]|nr:secondary thiamine-phosphate synthase enzyme YjbQ [Dehalococcoidales bacterium]